MGLVDPLGNGMKAWRGVLALLLAGGMGAVGPALGQSPAASPPDGAQPSAASAPNAEKACPPLSTNEVPYASTLKAKVTGTFDSARLKTGKGFWLTAARGMVFPECTIEQDAPIYGTITAASGGKGKAAELSLVLDHVDCRGKDKQAMKFWVLGVEGPADEDARMHDSTPTELKGGRRSITDAVAATDAYDARLGGAKGSASLKPGMVWGLRDASLALDPQGGPGCSAKLSSKGERVQLPPGTVLLLGVPM